MINFFHTHIDADAGADVARVLATTFISEGKLVAKFEAALSAQLGIRNPVAVNSGTAALHLALVLAGVKSGDEVVLPPQTFIASGLAVKYTGATPIFADIQYATGNIDPVSLRQKITDRTKAIMPVHWAGYPCDLNQIHAIAKDAGVPVVEDAAHALGATYKGTPVGALSVFTCFSFQAIKHLTTGDGGAIACLDGSMAENARKLRWFGIDRSDSTPSLLGERVYNANEVGFKYHLNDYSAALGLSNLKGIADRLTHVRALDSLYRNKLAGFSDIELFKRESDRESACWLFGVHIDRRDDFIRKMGAKGIPVSVVHQRIDRNDIFGGKAVDLAVQERFDSTQIHLPLNAGMSKAQVEYVVSEIRAGW